MICLNYFTFVKVEVIAEYFQYLPLSHKTIFEVKSVICWLQHMHRQFWCLILYVSFIGSEDPQRTCKILLYCFWCVWSVFLEEKNVWISKLNNENKTFSVWVSSFGSTESKREKDQFFSLLDLGHSSSPFLTYQKPGSQIFWFRPRLSYLDYTYFIHPPKHLLWWQAIPFTGSCNFTGNTS